MITLQVNEIEVTVKAGSTAAAAVHAAGAEIFRRSVTGDKRFPLCGMGICFECRVTIDGVKGQRSCQIQAAEGMRIETDE